MIQFTPHNIPERLAMHIFWFLFVYFFYMSTRVFITYIGYHILKLYFKIPYKKVIILLTIILFYQAFIKRLFEGDTAMYPLSIFFPLPIWISHGADFSIQYTYSSPFLFDILLTVLPSITGFKGYLVTIPELLHKSIYLLLINGVPALFLYYAVKKYLGLEGKIHTLYWFTLMFSILLF